MTQRWFRLLAVLLAITLIAAACGDDDDTSTEPADEEEAADEEEPAEEPDPDAPGVFCSQIDDGGEGDLSGETVTILGPETANEAEGFCASLVGVVEATGVAIDYTGTRDATVQTNVSVEAGNLPSDIVMIPQPGRLAGFASEGLLTAVPQETLDGALAGVSDTFLGFGTVDGTAYGVPIKADVKSLVWYSPTAFADAGYEVPTTLDELFALQDQIKADGGIPWCIGIESGDATGWPFTDWMEDLMLRFHGTDVYAQWPTHEIPFDDPQVKEVAEFVGEIWFDNSNVLGGRDAISTTGFRESALPLVDGDCFMHRQASFAGAFFVEAGATLGPDGDVSVFYFPVKEEGDPRVVLGGANIGTAWNEREATLAVFDWMGGPEAANARIVAQGGGYYSPNSDADDALYPSPVDPTVADILLNADAFGFDASDDMPGEANSEFWKSGTDYVSGAIDVDTFLATVEAAWPSE
jgi:alpha-glucoside transport system substrate-binding protein